MMQRVDIMNIMFLCSGNTCRSPMAEGIFKKLYSDDDRFSVKSAGLATSDGIPASKNSVKACKDIGIDISNYRSHSLKDIDLKETDLFVVMTESHKMILKFHLGVSDSKIYILNNGIADPYGCDIDTYIECRNQIYDGILKLYNEVLNNVR